MATEGEDAKSKDAKVRTVDDLSFAEIGNNILAPLLGGLVYSSIGKKFGYASSSDTTLTTQVPMGSPLRLTRTFPNGRVLHTRDRVRDEFELNFLGDETPPPKISDFTQAIDALHGQLVDLGYHMGQRIRQDGLPDGLGTNMLEKIIENRQAVAQSLTAEHFPQIPMRFIIDGEQKTVMIRNEPVGQGKMPMAHVLIAMGLAGGSVAFRNRPVQEFMRDALKGFVDKLPPVLSDVHRKLSAQLTEQGYSNAEKILRDSDCDIKRSVIRGAFEQMLPFADVYETASELRGEKPDKVVRAFQQIRKHMGAAPADITARDSYEYALLLEGMLDYAIKHCVKQDKLALMSMKEDFTLEMRKLLPNDTDGFGKNDDTPDISVLMELPVTGKIMDAFKLVYAGTFLLEHDMKNADRAWASKVTGNPNSLREL